jgi:ketosteroid isomerase-like protein
VRDTQRHMPEENVELVRRGFMAAMEEDWPTALETLDPDAEIHDFDIPDAGLYRGHDGFRAWLEGWGEGWESWRVEDVELRPVGDDHVLALFRIIASGTIARMEYFNDQGLAREAVGVRD